MRPLILLLCLLPLTAQAQSRADSQRHQQLPHNQAKQAFPQDAPRTEIFCTQYATAMAGPGGLNQGSSAGATFGRQTGYLVTRDRKQAEALGMVGGAIGSALGNQTDDRFRQFHFSECMAGKRLMTPPN